MCGFIATTDAIHPILRSRISFLYSAWNTLLSWLISMGLLLVTFSHFSFLSMPALSMIKYLEVVEKIVRKGKLGIVLSYAQNEPTDLKWNKANPPLLCANLSFLWIKNKFSVTHKKRVPIQSSQATVWRKSFKHCLKIKEISSHNSLTIPDILANNFVRGSFKLNQKKPI